MKDLFEQEIEEIEADKTQYERRKLQAWGKIIGNRQRLGHRERFSFTAWCYQQAKDKDKLSEKSLAYLSTVCRLKDAKIARATLKRAKAYEQAILDLRAVGLTDNYRLAYQPIIQSCECSKCLKR